MKRYYYFQTMVRAQMDNYVHEDSLRQLTQLHPLQFSAYPLKEQQFYARITRILVHWFLQEEINVCVLTSRRMERAKKNLHLAAIRSIRARLPQLLSH